MVILPRLFDGFIVRAICSMIYSIQCGLSKNGSMQGGTRDAHARTKQT
jgi:hypothetical protein